MLQSLKNRYPSSETCEDMRRAGRRVRQKTSDARNFIDIQLQSWDKLLTMLVHGPTVLYGFEIDATGI